MLHKCTNLVIKVLEYYVTNSPYLELVIQVLNIAGEGVIGDEWSGFDCLLLYASLQIKRR
jgi:hypothetical protein